MLCCWRTRAAHRESRGSGGLTSNFPRKLCCYDHTNGGNRKASHSEKCVVGTRCLRKQDSLDKDPSAALSCTRAASCHDCPVSCPDGLLIQASSRQCLNESVTGLGERQDMAEQEGAKEELGETKRLVFSDVSKPEKKLCMFNLSRHSATQ